MGLTVVASRTTALETSHTEVKAVSSPFRRKQANKQTNHPLKKTKKTQQQQQKKKATDLNCEKM